MSNTRRLLRPGLVALATFGALIASIAVRAPLSVDDEASAAFHDPPTGAILIDLDDDLGEDGIERVSRTIRRAIEPYAWGSGVSAFGTELHDAENLYRIEPPSSEIGDVLRALHGHRDVELVELERVWTVPTPPAEGAHPEEGPAPDRRGFTPNDPYYRHQWHMDQIQMPLAWASTRRGKGAVVAVIDTGVLYRDHGPFRRAPDLAETAFVPGRDFVDNNAEPDDEHGHGTHVAGTIAQSTNNGIGVAGVAPGAAIMPIRVLNRQGAGGWGAVAAGIRWAADHGANVINLSLGGGIPSRTIAKAVRYAHDKGVTVVAAAGNTGRGRVQYPAANQGALAVGAVRFDGERTFYSSYGPGLGIMAPGGDLRVDQNGDGLPDGVLQNTMVRGDPSKHDYVAYQGTSMAAPHVAGAAALLYAEGVRDPDTIVSMLRKTAESRGAESDYGAGILKAGDATALATKGIVAGRLAVCGLMLFAALGVLRRRKSLGVAPLSTSLVAFAMLGGLRLFPLEGLAPDALLVVAGGLPMALSAAPAFLYPLVASAFVPFMAIALLLSVDKARPFLVGASAAFAACLLVEALVPTTVAWRMGPAILAGPWLVLHAGIAAYLTRAAARRG